MIQLTTTPTRKIIVPTARMTGRYDGSGRWTSSVGCGRRPPLSVSSASDTRCLVDGRGQERGAEHDEADGARDQRGADVLLGQSAIHDAMVCIRSVPESDIPVIRDCALTAHS